MALKIAVLSTSRIVAEVMREIGCSERTYKSAYAELVKAGDIGKYQLNQKNGSRGWFTQLAYQNKTGCTETNI